MDDTYRELRRFARALEDFTDALRTSDERLAELEDKLRGVWDDSFQREFSAQYDEVAAPIRKFLITDAVRYSSFLPRKTAAVKAYLDHG